MVALQVSNEELALIGEVLESAYGDLREEIYKTDDHEYKQQLRTREEMIATVLERISATAATAAS